MKFCYLLPGWPYEQHQNHKSLKYNVSINLSVCVCVFKKTEISQTLSKALVLNL